MVKALPVVFGYLSAAFWILNFRPFITKFAPAASSIHADGLGLFGFDQFDPDPHTKESACNSQKSSFGLGHYRMFFSSFCYDVSGV